VVGHLSERNSMRGTLRESSFTGEPFFFFLEPEDIKSKTGDHLELWLSKRAPIN
jgi:hypothetical protein